MFAPAGSTRGAMAALLFGLASACTFPEYDLYRGAVGGGGGAAPVAAGATSEAGSAMLPVPSGCAAQWHDGNPYLSCNGTFTFDEAEAKCEQQQMRLLKIDDAAENAFALALARSLGPYVWIGGSNDDRNSVDFAWRDGDVFFSDGQAVPGRYHNFAPGQPEPARGVRCVQLEEITNGVWSAAQCSDSQQLICEVY